MGADLDRTDPARGEAIAAAAVDLAVDLVRIDTVNPGLVPGAAGEAGAVELLRGRLGAAGFECAVVTPPRSPDRPSLVARRGRPAPGRGCAPYWMESALWQQAGIPAVVCGPAGGGLHADDEWVDLAQVRRFAVALAGAAAEFCAAPA